MSWEIGEPKLNNMRSRDGPDGCLEQLIAHLESQPKWLYYASFVIILGICALFGMGVGLWRVIYFANPSRLPVPYTATTDGFKVERKLGWYDQFGGYNATEYFVYFNLANRVTAQEAGKTCRSRGSQLLDIENLEEETFVLQFLNDIIDAEYHGWRTKKMFTFWTGGKMSKSPFDLDTYFTWPHGKMVYRRFCPDWHWPVMTHGTGTFVIVFDAYTEPSPQFGCWMPFPDKWHSLKNLYICKRKRAELRADSVLQAFKEELGIKS